MAYTVESRDLYELSTAVIKARLPIDQVSTWLPWAFKKVFAELARQGIKPAGQPFARYAMHPDVFDVEAGVPVTRPVRPWGQVLSGTLPAGPAVVTTHIGPYEGLSEAVAALDDWIAEHDAEPAGAHWEIYFSDPVTEPDPATWRTDVFMPWARISDAD
jgi:effector-binding domain-containing protein